MNFITDLDLPNNIKYCKKLDNSKIEICSNFITDFFHQPGNFVNLLGFFLLVIFIPLAFILWAFHLNYFFIIFIVFLCFILGSALSFRVNKVRTVLDSYFLISSSKIEISSNKKYKKIIIERENIFDIYIIKKTIKNSQYNTVFNVILKCKKPIYLPSLKKYNEEFNLFGDIDIRYKMALETIVKEIKTTLNLYGDIFNENKDVITYFEMGKIKFTKYLDEIKIISDSDDFFSTKFISCLNNIIIHSVIFLFLFVFLFFIYESEFYYAFIVGLFIVLLILIFFALFLGEIIFTLNSDGINVKTEKKSFWIPKEEIADIYSSINIEEYNTRDKIERKKYYNIILQCKYELFLAPIRRGYKREFNMFGNINVEDIKLIELAIREMKDILKLNKVILKKS